MPWAVTNIAACQNLAAADVYRLTQNLNFNGSTCMVISASNIALDLQGFQLSGNRTLQTSGVLMSTSANNVTVMNGSIRDFDAGTFFNGVSNATAFNVTYFNNTNAILSQWSNDTNVSYSNLSYSVQDGLSYSNSRRVNVTDSNVSFSGDDGIDFDGGVIDARVSNVRSFNNTDSGIGPQSSLNVVLYFVTVYNQVNGVLVENASNTNLSYSNVSYHSRSGVESTSSNGLQIHDNVIHHNGLSNADFSGIQLGFSNASIVTSNSIYNNSNGVTIANSTSDRVHFGSVFNNTQFGFLFRGANQSILVSNATVSGNYASAYRDFSLQERSAVTLHQVAFNKSSLDFDNGNSNLTVNWTVYVNATNAAGALLGFTANLSSAGSATANHSVTTNATGFTVQNVTEYFQNGSQSFGVNESNYNPYTVHVVSPNGLSTYRASWNFSQTRQVNILFPGTLAVGASGISSMAATVSWSSGELTNATLNYGVSNAYGLSAVQTAFATVHSLSLSSLSPGTTYHYSAVSCTSLNACNASADQTFDTPSLYQGSGSTATPTPTPFSPPASAGATPTVAVSPVPPPIPPVPTAQPVFQAPVPVVVEEPLESQEGQPADFELFVRQAVEPVILDGVTRSQVVIQLENREAVSFKDLTLKYKLPDSVTYRGSDPALYPELVFDPVPERMELGSAVVVWLFDEVKPGQSADVSVTLDRTLEPEEIQSVSPPAILAKSIQASAVDSAPSQEEIPTATPDVVSGGFDFTLPALAILVLLVGGVAYWFTRRT
ncbi:right-handed parallel beta-helix repeat-containing protein [Candidatus Micrarchaeota archaeon]|nr:right-handed parallel beta-helix repeat-containing protein [Candidatus Micrarchaeota archaeon]